MKSLKILIGFGLVLAALYVIVGEQLSGTSADAFVNARLSTTRAPIAGMLELIDRPLGAQVRAGEPLGSISDGLVDNIRLADLMKDDADLHTEGRRQQAKLASIEGLIGALEKRSGVYLEERTRQLKANKDAADSEIAVAETRLGDAVQALERAKTLNARGVTTNVSLDDARSLVAISGRELENAKAGGAAARISLDAAQRGTFLGDGYNDQPYSQQRIAELALERIQLEGQISEYSARQQAMRLRIGAERLRVNRLSSAALRSNVNGVLWDYLSARGETVQRGQDLLRLVDCDTAIVTLSVSESVYNTLRAGASATFKLNGASKSLRGTVTRLGGSGAISVYRNLAIAPSQRHLERFDVALDVPALRNDPALRCLIGRTGRVFFERRPLDWLRQFWN